MNILKTLQYILLFSLLTSCSSDYQSSELNIKELREELVKANILLTDSEDIDIEDFLKRYKWQMNETGSGLRYKIYEQGRGNTAQKGKIVQIHYQIYLITGDLIYSSEQDGIKEFVIGRGGVESGLEEGILLLREGDKARFIMPSHLAHGLPGDGVKIPKRATLIYDVELIALKNL